MQKNWMQADQALSEPYIVVFRNRFRLKAPDSLNFRFSADERCQLFLNGDWIADGPERGSPQNWYWQECCLTLPPGEYCLCARVLCFGLEWTSHAQTSLRHGFFLDESSHLLGAWDWQLAEGFNYRKPWPDWGVYPRFELRDYNWQILSGQGGTWRSVSWFTDDRRLLPPALPLMRRQEELRYRREKNRFIFDDYVCVWSEFVFSGVGTVKLRWSECFYDSSELNRHNLKGDKGKRDGDYIVSEGNCLHINGSACRWVDYYWQSGRILELECDGVELVEVKFYSTGYPYQRQWQAHSSEPALNTLLDLAYRTLECCSHESYMDCPYYEQMMYIGDARLEALSSYVCNTDLRLAEKSLRLLAQSQQAEGMLLARYPARIDQQIPSFNLIYLMMLYDFALWQDKPELVREILPVTRRIIGYLQKHLRQGLLYLPGWNFIDWVPEWEHGIPKGGEIGSNSSLNYMAIIALQQCTALEKHFGIDEQAQINQELADEIETAVWQSFYDNKRGMLANDLEHQYFSEHAQVLALLSKPYPCLLEALQREKELPQTSIYFSFYYLEACYKNQQSELFYQRLKQWYGLEQKGLKTLPEEFANPRSDCHAWSSHVLYHYFASIMGIRPQQFGGQKVQVKPMHGTLQFAEGNSPSLEKYLKRMVKFQSV